MSTKAIHLGDGAYASVSNGNRLVITADHHDPAEATGVVYIEKRDAQKLIEFIEDEILGVERQ